MGAGGEPAQQGAGGQAPQCGGDQDCEPEEYCADGTCVIKKPPGDGCGAENECASSHCVDGVCCDTVCSASCESCVVSGFEGTCVPIPQMSDPDGECPLGACSGGGACQTTAVWAARFGDALTDVPRAVALDAMGNVIVTGIFTGTIDFGLGALSDEGSYTGFIVKLDPMGNPLWSQSIGTADPFDVAIDSANQIVVTGRLTGSASIAGGPTLTAAGPDLFVAKLTWVQIPDRVLKKKAISIT